MKTGVLTLFWTLDNRSNMVDIATVLIFVVVFLISFLVLSRQKGLPPGPTIALPIIGSYFFLKQLQKKRIHLTLLEAAEIYGKVFSFRIGQQFVVVLTGFDAIQQTFVKQSHVFSDRPVIPGFLRTASAGIALRPYTQCWSTLRRFTLQTLRDFGVGKTTFEEKISVEIGAARVVIDASVGEHRNSPGYVKGDRQRTLQHCIW